MRTNLLRLLGVCVLFVVPVSLVGCIQAGEGVSADAESEAVGAAQEELLLGDCTLSDVLLGRDLFDSPEFGTNGVSCGSCHRHDTADDNFDLTPEAVEALFASNPNDPLFNPLNSLDANGTDYSALREHATVPIPVVLPDNVTVDELDSPMVRVDPLTGQVTVFVHRSTQSIEDIALVEHELMWDGRFSSLEEQAPEAQLAHFAPDVLMSTEEAHALSCFQRQHFSGIRRRLYALGGSEPGRPQIPSWASGPDWDLRRQGRPFFMDMPVVPGGPRGGHCATCHSGPMLNETNAFNPVQGPGERFTNNFVAEVNDGPLVPGAHSGNGFAELTYHVTLEHDLFMPPGIPFPIPPGTPLFPAGTVFTFRSPDPGRVLVTGNPCEVALGCVINSPPGSGITSTVSITRISSLWGSADSGPYFRDHSADTYAEVVHHYNSNLFFVTALGTGNPAWIMTPEEEAAAVAYAEWAFRRRTLQ